MKQVNSWGHIACLAAKTTDQNFGPPALGRLVQFAIWFINQYLTKKSE